MKWKIGKVRPKKPLVVTVDGVTYTGWVSEIFKAYINRAAGEDRRLPPGWEERVWMALNAAYPKYVYLDGSLKAAPPQVSIATIRSFLNFVRKRGLVRSFVPLETARKRAEICAQCPKAGVITGCTKCKALVNAIIRPPKGVELPKDKSGCTACGCYNDIKVWIPRDQLQDEAGSYDWWEKCWMLQPVD